MKLFLKSVFNFFGIICIPLLLILMAYLYSDPFKVVHAYRDYSNSYVSLNRDYISTEMFLKNVERYKYNSFIFGSSRTLAFRPQTWKQYLSKNDSPFMFDASAETINGIYTKMKYLNSSEYKIKNAIIVLCRDVSFQGSKSMDGYLFAKHPTVAGSSYLYFHYLFFKAFLDGKFLFNYYDYTLTKNYKARMSGYIENRKINFDTITNELRIVDQEQMILNNPQEYYSERKFLFYTRGVNLIDTIDRIDKKNIELLKGIKKILNENKTKYRVVISPLYEQMQLSIHDKKILFDLFGNNLFDFSGKNQITENYTNYYETSHFRKEVGDSLFRVIYSTHSE